MRSQDEENTNGIVTQVGMDIKGKGKLYQQQYYLQRNEDNKMKKSDSDNVFQSEVDARKESKKENNRWYYAQQKEKKRLKQIANGEGGSQSTPFMINTAVVDSTQMSVEQPTRVPLGIINASDNSNNTQMRGITSNLQTAIPHSLAANKENMTPFPTQFLNGVITQGTPISSNTPAHRKTYMRNYYQLSKQKKINSNPSVQKDMVQTDPYDFIFNDIPQQHNVLKKQRSCVHCGALRIQFEFPTFCRKYHVCCHLWTGSCLQLSINLYC